MADINWLKTMGWNGDNVEDLRNAAYAYIRQGKYKIALPFFEALLVLDPESSYDAQTLGAIYLELNNPGKALKYLDRALKLEADHGPTLLNVTKALFMLGKKEEGLKLAEILKNEKNLAIANVAKALSLAYS
jgi:tetratricopeptide (TPR) repeat protein